MVDQKIIDFINKLQVGDTICFKPENIGGSVLAYGGKYCHTAKVVAIDKVNNIVWIIESHLDHDGVKKLHFDFKYIDHVDVRRYIIGLSNEEKIKQVEWLESKIDKKYGLRDFLPTIWHLLFGKREKHDRNNINNEWYCSELTAGADKSCGIDAIKKVNYHNVIPSDYGWKNSNYFIV